MVLASQTPRKTNTWRHMTNERRRGRSMSRFLLIGGAAAIVGVGVWAIFFRSPSGESLVEQDGAQPPAESTASEAPAAPIGSSRAAEAIRGSGPPQGEASTPPGASGVITMGGRDEGAPPGDAGLDRPSSLGDRTSPEAASTDGAPAHTSPPSPPPAVGPDASTPARTGAAAPKGPADDDGASGSAGRSAGAAISPEPLSAALALAERDPVAARARLSAMIEDARFSPAEQSRAREAVGAINRRLLLAPVVVPGDPLARTYTVKSGDSLQKIARAQGLGTDWRFIKRVNGIDDERKLKSGQTLKLVPGVFHATVDKSDYRMDVFVEEAGKRTFVCSLPVGLGEFNSTPTGRFKVRQSSKLVNPAWTNPRTGEHYRADDPKNPIGEFWIGLKGVDKANEGVDGYGIHGTVDPASIGRQASMGCVRLAAPDIALVYELLTEPDSMVEIRE